MFIDGNRCIGKLCFLYLWNAGEMSYSDITEEGGLSIFQEVEMLFSEASKTNIKAPQSC